MRKFYKTTLVIILLMTSFRIKGNVQAGTIVNSSLYSTANELVGAVNNLRSANGLAPYQVNPILMGIAQSHAEYLVSIGTLTHVSGDGMRPFQRALAAGYLVAGDLSLGGWFSENITGGVSQTAEEAVQIWMEDEPHRNTMLSGTLRDIGVGVGMNGNTYYYVLDAGLSTGGTPVAFTPPAISYSYTPTLVINTPNPDGTVIHIVHRGDTLGSISLAYGVPLGNILKLNGLTINSTIYVDQKIRIQAALTPTPTQPTSTPTIPATITPWPTSTQTYTPTEIPPTPTPFSSLPITAGVKNVILIAISALFLAGMITFLWRKRR
jgi:uncharacterized protein YkwD